LERQNAPKEEQTPEQYVADTLKRAEDVVSGESFTVGSFDAYLASLNVDDGKYTARLIGVIYKDGGVYMFKGDSREGEDPEQFVRDVRATMETFRAMTAADLRTANDQRIRVIDARPGDTYASLARKTSIRRFPEENLRLLNGDHPVGEPRPGDRIKIVQ
jgi:predicted Zn-dependent protease